MMWGMEEWEHLLD